MYMVPSAENVSKSLTECMKIYQESLSVGRDFEMIRSEDDTEYKIQLVKLRSTEHNSSAYKCFSSQNKNNNPNENSWETIENTFAPLM